MMAAEVGTTRKVQNEKNEERKTRKKEARSRATQGTTQTPAFEGEEEDGRSVTELSERGKRPRAKPRMTWTEEMKEQVRELLTEGRTVLEVAERMGLDYGQVRNAVARYKLRESGSAECRMQDVRSDTSSVSCADSFSSRRSQGDAEQRIEPLGVVSLIRDYAKCITALPSADIRNYEKIVRTFAESIIEGADSILREGEKYGV